MLFASFLLAVDQTNPQGEAPPWLSWPFLLAAIGVFYFVMILPMRKQEKQRKALIGALKKGDKVLNSGGIIGIVESIKAEEDAVLLRGGLWVTKSSIVKVFTPEEMVKEQKSGGA